MAVSTREQEVLEALRVVQDPDLHRDIVSLGFIQNMTIDPSGAVAFNVNLTTPACPVNDQLCAEAFWFGQTKLLGSRSDMDRIAEVITSVQKRAGDLAKV